MARSSSPAEGSPLPVDRRSVRSDDRRSSLCDPLPILVLRRGGRWRSRAAGPILVSVKGQAVAEGAASRLLGRVVRGGRQQPCQSTHAARTLLHLQLDQRRPCGHGVRAAPGRRPHHYPLQPGTRQHRPSRSPQRRRVPRRHGHLLSAQTGLLRRPPDGRRLGPSRLSLPCPRLRQRRRAARHAGPVRGGRVRGRRHGRPPEPPEARGAARLRGSDHVRASGAGSARPGADHRVVVPGTPLSEETGVVVVLGDLPGRLDPPSDVEN